MEEKKRRPRLSKSDSDFPLEERSKSFDESENRNESNDRQSSEDRKPNPENTERKPWQDRSQQGGGEGGERRPWQDRSQQGGGQQGGGYERRPWQDRSQQTGSGEGGERKPWQDRSQQGGGQQGGGYERRPWQDRSQQTGSGEGGERKPWQDRSQQGGGQQGGGYERRPWQDRSPQGGGGEGGERRPWQDRSQQGGGQQGGGYERKPWQDRSQQSGGGEGGERRPWQDRSQQGGGHERKPWQDRSQQSGGGEGGERRPWQDRSQQGGGGERKPYDNRSSGGGGGYERRPYDNRSGGGGGGFGGNRSFGRKPFRKKEEFYVEQKPKPALPSGEGMPLNKYLAHCGLSSRRKAVEYVEQGKVTVNGEVKLEPYYRIQPSDVVICDGNAMSVQERQVYVLLNKPKGVITTTDDERGRPTVLDIVDPAFPERLYPVGRLDRDTTGLILITNDGDLAQKLSHPSHAVQKQYRVGLRSSLTQADFELIERGVKLEDGIMEVNWIRFSEDHPDRDIVELEITSGRNRVVRRMFEALGYEVFKLDRFYFAGLTKKELPRGSFRELTQREVVMLKHFTGHPSTGKKRGAGGDTEEEATDTSDTDTGDDNS